LSSSADDFRIVVSLAMDEPTLKPKMTARMTEMVEFRMAASLNGALACNRTTIGRLNSIGQPKSQTFFCLGICDHHTVGLTATFNIGCLGKFCIQAQKFTHPCADRSITRR
jgi:hypothetical protein